MADTIYTSQTPATVDSDTTARDLGERFSCSVAGKQVTGGRVWVAASGLADVDIWQLWHESTATLLASFDLNTLDPGDVVLDGWTNIPDLPTPVPLTVGDDYIVCHYQNGPGSFSFVYTSPVTYPFGSGGSIEASIGVYRNGGTPADMPTNTFASAHFADVFVEDAAEVVSVGTAVEKDFAFGIDADVVVAVGTAGEKDFAGAVAASAVSAVGIAVEKDFALAIDADVVTNVGTAVEKDFAGSFDSGISVPVGTAEEKDHALAIANAGDLVVPVGTAIEIDRAVALRARPVPGQPQLASIAWELAKTLRDCLCAKLAETVAGPVCRCSLMSGDTAIADICEDYPGLGNGQAWVRMTRLFVSREFPRPIVDLFNCAGGFWVAEFELGVLRCGVGPDDEGQPPTAEELNIEAAMVFDDAYAVRFAAECCVPGGLPSIPGEWQPMSGGRCTGGRVTVMVQLVPGPLETNPDAAPPLLLP